MLSGDVSPPLALLFSTSSPNFRHFFFPLHPTPTPQITSNKSHPKMKGGRIFAFINPSLLIFKLQIFLASVSVLLNKNTPDFSHRKIL